jgi:hypothetical protein
MEFLACELCETLAFPYLKSAKIRKMTRNTYIVDDYVCRHCGNATFIRMYVHIKKEK